MPSSSVDYNWFTGINLWKFGLHVNITIFDFLIKPTNCYREKDYLQIVFFRDGTGRFISEDWIQGSPGINKNIISNKIVFVEVFLFRVFWNYLQIVESNV